MGRVFFAAFIVGGLVLSSICFGYSGGSGTAEDPYRIASKADLLELAGTTTDYNKCFILTADIDMQGQVFTTAIIAADTNSDDYFQGTAFTGTFDGNSHKITNFTINGGSNDYLGLFGYINSGGSIKNLGLENCTVSGISYYSQYTGSLVGYNGGFSVIDNCYSTGSVSGYLCFGGLVGYNDSSSISNCYSTGTVSGPSHAEHLGGLVGYNYRGSISQCYSTGSVSGGSHSWYIGGLVSGSYGTIIDCYSTGTVSGASNSYYVGGLVGYNVSGISNCYSTGAVSGYLCVGGLVGFNTSNISHCYSMGTVNSSSNSWRVGGLVGDNYGSISDCYSMSAVSGGSYSEGLGGLVGGNNGTISDCYSTGSVSGSSYVGGLVGYNAGSISNCYFLDTSGPVNGYGEPLTDEQMKQQASFTGWDFVGETANGTEDIWRMCIDGVNYPLLWWQFNAADFTCPDGVNFIDFAILANAWLSDPVQANWNGRCDIAEPPDDVIDMLDLAIFCDNWLE